MSTPAKNSLRRVSFFTLAGVACAELQSNGEVIAAVQKNPLPEFRHGTGPHLCQLFANWPSDDEAVLRFTKRFGALTAPLKSGAPFSFVIADWRLSQLLIIAKWDIAAQFYGIFGHGNQGVEGLEEVRVGAGERFICRPHCVEYRANSLLRFIYFQFHSIRWENLRRCGRTDCKTPYFVAKHLGQLYCCNVCSQAAQRDWKKKWWEENGPAWRNRRSKTKKLQKSTTRGGSR